MATAAARNRKSRRRRSAGRLLFAPIVRGQFCVGAAAISDQAVALMHAIAIAHVHPSNAETMPKRFIPQQHKPAAAATSTIW